MNDEPPFSPVVVAPTFNNAPMLRDVAGRILRAGLPLIVVNDGSTDQTASILEDLSKVQSVRVIRHPRNRGKARALLGGFEAAARQGHTHAITIDTDGQLDPDEIPRLVEAARKSPRALVLGVRDDTAVDYPSRSRLGRRISNLLVRLECGQRVADSQCGFRAYPLELVRAARCRSGRYGFETEIITRAVWAGASVREVPVTCRYALPIERISHFQPVRDSLRAVVMHARLLARAMMPWAHRKGPEIEADRSEKAPAWWRTMHWINPARAWRDLREQRLGAPELAAGVAVGVFIGNLPVYGVQTILSLYTARRLHLHPLAVVAGSHVSTPPAGPVLIAAAIGVGHWLLHGSWLTLPAWQGGWRGWASLLGNLMLDWTVGAVVVGGVLSAAAFALSYAMLSRMSRRLD